ncbi:alpha/beta hydrolase [Shewanella sp. 1_MG-2023]|uniref:alpha/beta fold hydrolase n=1 Tax=unclassified Shewanella TaxID=196818 RepID=UPI0026E31799|nr:MULTISPECIES: alpha/beta hydrolase [unclassified Shewanella]MDO6611249.1 alpha/beta hydrolase [Shewanella sp. 7_MG-2023]MDO6771104.1 alpha/beta hydrolase [Shewanella sp. 2_MG-2023]MDO6796347.1 alpha/beta hydrolase [Shewanella sp. 1_MG-2023]
MATWVLLRGLMRDSRHWYGFDAQLRDEGIDVLTPDATGNGTLASKPSHLTIGNYTDDIWQQIDKGLNDNPEFSRELVIIGVSMGGMIALEMARQRHKQVRHVVLINSSAGNLSPWYQRFQLRPLINSIWHRHKAANLSFIESCVLNYTTVTKADDESVISDWGNMRSQLHTSIINGARQIYAAARYQCTWFGHCRVSVIGANQDKLANPKCSKALAEFYHTPLLQVEQCGHDATLDHPDQIRQLIQDTISESAS